MALYSSKTSTSGMKRNKSRLTMGYQVKKRVLVIDDIGVILDLVEFLLQKGGYDVMTATDAASALAQIEKITPDLILLDIMMPDISGYEFIAQLRQHQNHYASILLYIAYLNLLQERKLFAGFLFPSPPDLLYSRLQPVGDLI